MNLQMFAFGILIFLGICEDSFNCIRKRLFIKKKHWYLSLNKCYQIIELISIWKNIGGFDVLIFWSTNWVS